MGWVTIRVRWEARKPGLVIGGTRSSCLTARSHLEAGTCGRPLGLFLGRTWRGSAASTSGLLTAFGRSRWSAGAAEVLATDLPSPFQARAQKRFEHVRELLGSSVRYEERDVFDLEGEFDVLFAGYVLQMVRDPIGALASMRRVCRGHLILLETISWPLAPVRAPVARLDARHDGSEWFVFNRRGLSKALELAGWAIEAQTETLRDQAGPLPIAQKASRSLKYRLGVRGRSCALRAAPTGSAMRLFGTSG